MTQLLGVPYSLSLVPTYNFWAGHVFVAVSAKVHKYANFFLYVNDCLGLDQEVLPGADRAQGR